MLLQLSFFSFGSSSSSAKRLFTFATRLYFFLWILMRPCGEEKNDDFFSRLRVEWKIDFLARVELDVPPFSSNEILRAFSALFFRVSRVNNRNREWNVSLEEEKKKLHNIMSGELIKNIYSCVTRNHRKLFIHQTIHSFFFWVSFFMYIKCESELQSSSRKKSRHKVVKVAWFGGKLCFHKI